MVSVDPMEFIRVNHQYQLIGKSLVLKNKIQIRVTKCNCEILYQNEEQTDPS